MASINVVSAMETWARWRANGCRRVPMDPDLGAAISCMTGKLLTGMGTTICPICKGEGRAPGYRLRVAAQWVDPCPQCSGWGRSRSGDLEAMKRSRTIDCPDCVDDYGVSRGEVNGRTCMTCKGSTKKVMVLFFQVNPASINATRFVGANEDDDPMSQMIDRTVAEWAVRMETLLFHTVAVIEYAIGGTQEYKAREAQRYFRRATNYREKLDVSQPLYSVTLDKVHSMVDRQIHKMLDTRP